MKHFFSQPKNIRIIRENAIAGIIIFLLMGFVGPFGVNELSNTRFLYFVLIGLVVFLVGVMSGFFVSYVLKLPLDPSLPLRTVNRNALIMYLINLPLTAAVITTIFGMMYRLHLSEIWLYEGRIIWVPYYHFLYYTVSLGTFVYIGTFIRNRNWHLRYELEEMRAINQLLEQNAEKADTREAIIAEKTDARKDNIAENDSHERTATEYISQKDKISREALCRFEGSTANSTLAVLPSQIIYVESMANYADIWYLDNDTPNHKMLRITLKQIKQKLDTIDYLAQCHRAFIVNLHFVVAMTNNSNSYQLQLFGTEKSIPVSRTYTPEMKSRLQNILIPRT